MSKIEDFFDINQKVVVITGASGQLGRLMCSTYVSLGARVIAWDVEYPKERIESVVYEKVDIGNKFSVDEAMYKVFDSYKKVDVLINNAGVSTFEPFEDRSEDKFDWVLDVNLKGTFLCIQSFVKNYDSSVLNNASIINIGSMYGIISPDPRIYSEGDRKNSEVYGASKAAVIQMTKYFSVHLAERGIRVNAVSPGGVFNPKAPQSESFISKYEFRCPMNRMADENEMMGAIIYFSSKASSYTTGQNLVVDGGMTAW